MQCYPPELIAGLFLWDMRPFVLHALSKQVEFFGPLSLFNPGSRILRLFAEVLSFGLGVEKSHLGSASPGQQERAGQLLTWGNHPHMVQPTAGLLPASKPASEHSKIPHFPGPSAFTGGS